ncbi:sulfatase-like hydrolase/transferase [Enterococcus diestrammenae]|uniref:sulfatase-like hydrolase/transferase n=1 Tax=Enterococcus diestrammenae TaxID=1155073 RepID=UPI00195E2D68
MTNKPNILFILTDQQRKDTLSTYGNLPVSTPNLDELAESSLNFDNAYAVCPICTPARASMQTGLYPMHHGMLTNSYNYGTMVQELPDTPEVLSRQLQTAGYQIGYTGKWHLGTGADAVRNDDYLQKYMGNIHFAELEMNARSVPTTLGYQGDDFPGHGFGGYIYDELKAYVSSLGKETKIENIISGNYTSHQAGEITSGLDTTIEHFLVERTKKWLLDFKKQDEPWYFQLNFWGPHEPYYAPTEFLNHYRDMDILPWENYAGDSDNKPRIHDVKRANNTEWEEFVPYIRHYYANMSHIDYQIGRLIQFLKDNDLYDNTLIIFSSDHGESLGIHNGLCDKAIFMYEEITSIPLLIKMPHETESHRISEFVQTCDLYSTILNAAGLAEEEVARDGRSLLPLADFKNTEMKAMKWRECVVTECSGIGSVLFSQRALRWKNWKYVFNAGDIDELYDLDRDPGELHNLIDDNLTILDLLRQILEDWMIENNDNLIFEYRYLRRR